jgi:mono/diheme cytochrome c family protein
MKPAIFVGIFCLVVYGLTLTRASAQSADQWQSGQQIYENVCQYCHINDVGPVLTGRDLPALYFKSIARSGLNGMPAFKPTELSDKDLDKIAEYLVAYNSDKK